MHCCILCMHYHWCSSTIHLSIYPFTPIYVRIHTSVIRSVWNGMTLSVNNNNSIYFTCTFLHTRIFSTTSILHIFNIRKEIWCPFNNPSQQFIVLPLAHCVDRIKCDGSISPTIGCGQLHSIVLESECAKGPNL